MVEEGNVFKDFSKDMAKKKKEDLAKSAIVKKEAQIAKEKNIPEEVKPIISSNKNSVKRERIILVSFLVIIILFTILFYNWESDQPQTHFVNVSDINFRQGVLLNLQGYSEIEFNFEDVGYKVKVDFVEGEMEFILDDVEDTLEIGDSFSYDLDGDSEKDFFVRFESFREGNASVYLKEIYEFDCPENWDCTDWGPCINAQRKRVCVDLNSCDDAEGMPALVEVC